jgi:hydroxyacyl-ACP dehydratase HTD2-like protein with hotdog domain
MWASGSLTFHSELKLGEEITKDTTLLDIKEKKISVR